jgi:(p)ppGpp synthase/HD superfamily hydrolase
MTTDLPSILTALGAHVWPREHQSHGRLAANLALTVYDGHQRDQGTPYLEHPIAVVRILRTELSVSEPTTLTLGLLHDALEVAPHTADQIPAGLGKAFTDRLRAMTPDHRLQQRAKHAEDDAAWRTKTTALDTAGLLIRLADRIHNLRDLQHSPDTTRRSRYMAALAAFYLPLADAVAHLDQPLATARDLLHAEYTRIEAEGAVAVQA